MEQIHKGVREKIFLSIYQDETLTQADGGVVLTAYDADDSTNTVVETGSATYNSVSGQYEYMLSMTTVSLNRTLRIVWSYSLSGSSTEQTDYIEIITPYATVSDIIDYYNFGSKPNEPNYKSQEQLVYAEQVARNMIDKYTMQHFGKRYGTQEIFGVGSDAIELTEKMLTIDKMYENDELVIDNTQNPVYNAFGFPVVLTPTGKAVRVSGQMWDVRYDNQVDVTMLNYGKFRNNTRYAFAGLIGYNYVPQDIKLCTILLVGDILSNDAAWRNKYLNKVSLSEISFEMAPGAFNGTGNLIVDGILDSYRNVGIVII